MAPGIKRKTESNATGDGKPSKRAVRTRRGKLDELPNMPLDILYELFSHLQPLDILQLSRTNAAFRALLMARSASSFWTAARQNVPGLPDPFPGMSEPAFANLCFVPCCHICLKSNTRDVIWEYRVRLCNDCKKTSTMRMSSLLNSEFYIQERCRVLPHITAEVCVPTVRGSEVWTPGGMGRIFIPDIQEIKVVWESLTNNDAQDNFLKAQDQRYKEIEEHAKRCRTWFENKKAERSDELQNIRIERFNTIITKLEELGYKEDVDFLKNRYYRKQEFRDHPFVRQSKRLTDRIWENNRAEFISFFEQNVVSRRLYEEYGEVLSSRIRLLREAVGTTLLPKYRPIFPPLRDLVSFPEVQAMIDPHRSHKFGRREIKYLVSIIDDIIVSWKADCTKQLEEAFRSEAPYIPEDTAILNLAITNITRCRAGPKPCRVLVDSWPNAVIHPCKWNAYWRNTTYVLDPEHDPGRWCSLIIRRELNRRWSKHDIETLIRGVAKIVQACGKDPLRTTAEEMDGLDLRFYCAREEHESGIREIMEWRQAAVKESEAREQDELRREEESQLGQLEAAGHGENYTDWRVLSSEDRQKIAHLESAASECTQSLQHTSVWHCVRCQDTEWEEEPMAMHVKSAHSIETPGEDDLFLSHEEALPMECSVYIVRNAKKKSRRLPFEVKEAFDQGRAALWSEIFG